MFLIERGTDGEKTNPTVLIWQKKKFFWWNRVCAGPDSQIEEQIEFHGIELDWI